MIDTVGSTPRRGDCITTGHEPRAQMRYRGTRRVAPAGSMRLLADVLRVTLDEVTKTAAKLLEEALKLDPAGRAEFAAQLIASLDDGSDEDVEAAWAVEIEARATRARSGADPGEAWPEVRGRLERDLRNRSETSSRTDFSSGVRLRLGSARVPGRRPRASPASLRRCGPAAECWARSPHP